jgi:uncharacterized protein YceK
MLSIIKNILTVVISGILLSGCSADSSYNSSQQPSSSGYSYKLHDVIDVTKAVKGFTHAL